MPPIFKALATIMAWMLWIASIVSGFSALIMGIITGALYSTTEPRTTAIFIFPAIWAVSAFDAIAAVVIMYIRKKME